MARFLHKQHNSKNLINVNITTPKFLARYFFFFFLYNQCYNFYKVLGQAGPGEGEDIFYSDDLVSR